ncbi:antiviral reverse transcriptase Drt3b [Spongiibacter tropicus]|uniref:antiviral reverse transcriptase Drt3b n=1 Tax=Spongiibacter tropicus TaxID=454602 RepID=UPI0003B4305A|nr:antiviral reverse transcriptase Drt3b [Spongiibacter tropicus]
MPKIIKVDTNDKLRTLLTDVLPYELPLWFSNFTMYQRLKNKTHLNAYKTISGLDFNNPKGVYIPLEYTIQRGGNKTPRTISIMHPAAQMKVCDFYHEYDNLIKYYCTRSKYSLRHPYRKTTKFYGKSSNGSKITEGVESHDEERVVSSSYFKYKKYPFLYRFFESYEYHKLEKQFHSMLQVDISKCFPSIYTHSIGWATKSKRIAKKKSEGSFDGEFDNLMQTTNYRETNGIIIGPEISRIFAEIILQKIDLDLVFKMKNSGYKISKDYEFRRYVDDYFIFFRSEDVKSYFIKSLELCLLEFKMHLNEAKTTISSRPFATNISLSKYSASQYISKFYRSRYRDNEDSPDPTTQLKNPSAKANKTISEIKMAIANHNIEYNSISNYLFSSISKRVITFLSKIESISPKTESHLNWLLVDLEILFFIHAMDIRIRPTDRLARLINDLLEKIENWPETHKEIINKKIFDNVKHAIKIFIDHSNDIIGLETLNLLMILTMLPDDYRLSEKTLKDYLCILEKNSETNDFYFRWITFMLYIGEDQKYSELRNQLVMSAKEYFTENEDMFINAEYFMFYFDYIACPYIDLNFRKTVIEEVKTKTLNRKKQNVDFDSSKHGATALKNDFIVSWRDPGYLKNSLEKREYIFSYN